MDRTYQGFVLGRSSTGQRNPDAIEGLVDRLGYEVDPFSSSVGRTPLHLAAAAGDARACKILIEIGYAVTDVDAHGRSAAAFARSAGHFELAAALEGREETQLEIVARRPLNLAELNGLVADTRRTLERLVSAGRLAARDVKGDTPLHIVSLQGNLWAADMLVHAGADLHAVNLSGMTPEQAARVNGHGWLADQLSFAANGSDVPTGPVAAEPIHEAVFDADHDVDEPDASVELESFDEDALENLSFDGEVAAEEFHRTSGITPTRAEFWRVSNDVALQFDEAEADFVWDFNHQPRQIEGEGIKSDTGSEGDDFETYSEKSRRTLQRAVIPSTWNRFRVELAACAYIAERIVANGFFHDDDIAEILGACHGRFDPEHLRLNVMREIEAAGFDFVSEEDHSILFPMTDVSSDELTDAIVATCTRFARLPGTKDRILDGRSEKPLTDAVSLARRALLLGIVEHLPVLDIIIYMSEQVLLGAVDCGEVTHLQVNPHRRNGETERFDDALRSLRILRDRIATGSGSAVRQAVLLLSDLELRPDFLKSVIAEMRGSDELAPLAEPLARGVAALEASSTALVTASLPRCRRHAAQRTHDDEDQEEVFQASFFGLQRAAATFDPDRGHFSTHSSIWMIQALSRWRSNESRLIRLPVHLEQMVQKHSRVDEVLNPSLSTAERETAISFLLETTVEEVRRLDRVPKSALDLSSLEQHVSDAPQDGVPETVHAYECARIVNDLLSELDVRQAEILRLRFGVGTGEEMTLEEIGQLYGVTRERIRQIEAKAFRHLRHPVRFRFLERSFRP